MKKVLTRKLSEKQVDAIRERYSKGGISQRSLAKEFGVSWGHIWKIVNQKYWRMRCDENPQWRQTCIECGMLLEGVRRMYCSDACGDYYYLKHWQQENPEKIAEYCHRYMMSEKGKAWRERQRDTWRGKRAILIYDLERPCVDCGETNKLLLECDHLIPRAAGGTDDWDNLAIRCKECHKLKTKADYIKYGWVCGHRRE